MSLIMDVLRKNKQGQSTANELPQEGRVKKVMEKASQILSSPMGIPAVPPEIPRIARPEVKRAQTGIPSNVAKDGKSSRFRTIGLAVILSLIAILLLYQLGIHPWGKTNTLTKLQLTTGVSSKTNSTVTADSGPKIVLEGVIIGDATPLCVIKGQILKVGDSIEGYVIKSINSAGVRIVDETGKSTFIKIS